MTQLRFERQDIRPAVINYAGMLSKVMNTQSLGSHYFSDTVNCHAVILVGRAFSATQHLQVEYNAAFKVISL